jgi:hypothetical protein
VTTAFFQLRGGSSAEQPAPRTGSASSGTVPFAADAAAHTREVAQPRTPTVSDDNAGTSTDPGWWQRLPNTPAWDDAREHTVLERLAKHVGVTLDPKYVECKTRCCQIALDDATYEDSLDEITSSVGLGFEPPDGLGTSKVANGPYLVTACWSTAPQIKPLPDRAVERAALLAKAADEVRDCAHGVTPVITLKLQLHLDEDGRVEKVDSNAKQLGQKAASCAETALLAAASFAPAPMSTRVPITVALGK